MVKCVCAWPVAGPMKTGLLSNGVAIRYLHRVLLSGQLQDHHCSYNIINGINYLAI
jgi:hypothetical protein